MKQLYYILMLCCSASMALAQGEANNWHFGNQASFEFSGTGSPVSTFTSAMTNAEEGCASISDKNGQLLFYTNGETIWDRSNNIMLNGHSLMGHVSSTQSSLIVPRPGSDSLYYVFTTDAVQNNLANGLRYSVVDMEANWPLGAVVSGQKNIALYGSATKPVSEKLTAVKHFNNRDVWVIVQSYVSLTQQEFIAFLVTSSGISASPVISVLPAVAGSQNIKTGYLKASPLGNYLAGNFGSNGCYLFDFDNKTGSVSNPLQLTNPSPRPYYGLEFSPDESKLYTNDSWLIQQFNLNSGNPASILASRTSLNPMSNYGAMQLAPNGKIYIARPGQNALAEISQPNAPGPSCNLTMFGPNLVLPSNSFEGLPNFITGYFNPPRFEYIGNCAGNPLYFSIPLSFGIDSATWNFGDTGSGAQNFARGLSPNHVFRNPGNFTVLLTIFRQGQPAYYQQQVVVRNKPQVQLDSDIVACAGDSISLKNHFPRSQFNERYLWSTGETGFAISPTVSGIYWLELTNGFCTTRDSIKVTFRPLPQVSLGASQILCDVATVTLDAKNPGCTYYWHPGKETTQTITVTKSGRYTVYVTSPDGCTNMDFIDITMITSPRVELGDDIVVCEGEPVTLRATDPGSGRSVLWSDGSRFLSLQPTKSGKYWVQVTHSICTISDTINVTFKSCPPPPVPVIPNIITPNGDEKNDKLVLKEIPEGVWHLKLFNRWGQLLFDEKGYRNDWPKDKISDGTYYYLLEDPETKRTFKGWVEVVH
ncbi:T9SS type B sorting domain-containing protein [Adhaeribacter soli]|uniref:PKD domain-containing protein n=1 Tax=Adhaeribacter soli TaxID=2607655 RepID=A0A5N1J817_9BACT|nr:gliding motility-associated C-terminal domain-containing protein [Adhaeribacter soli]KAA9340811.1 hypothetical protein F0P94_05120 [Adhaeribacter soli]